MPKSPTAEELLAEIGPGVGSHSLTFAGSPCKVTRIGAAERLADLMARDAGSIVATRVLRRLGFYITQNTVRAHMRGECGCPK